MIEVIYKEEKSGEENELGFYLPRNIRQIGLIHENYRIYMEDYVYSFLGKAAVLSTKRERVGRAAVLTGEVRWKSNVTYVFVRGAILIEKTEVAADHVLLGEEAWKQIGEDCDTYFSNQEIVGWFLAQPEIPICATEILTRAHVKYFGGEKILFLMEPTEREDAFFRFENNFLVKQSGYYLYYEKNEAMQNYMLTQTEMLECNIIEKTEDEAVKNFRKIIQEKNNNKEEYKEGKNSFASFVATACLVLSAGAIGLRFYQNYREAQNYGMLQEAALVNSFETKPIVADTLMLTDTPLQKESNSEKLQKEKVLQISPKTEKAMVLTLTPTPSVNLEKMKTENKKVENKVESKDEEVNDKEIRRKMEEVKSAEDKETGNKQEVNEKVENNNIENENAKSAEDSSETTNQNTAFSYVVRPGDSLFQISLDHYGTIEKIPEICQMNGFSDEEVIYPGQIIVLP